tara:strand:+ start:63 stop:530 length:468 start_codon:yes stop_codon:yes gene_type:complete
VLLTEYKSYGAFRQYLFRKLGGGAMSRDKLIAHLYLVFVNDFGVNTNKKIYLTKSMYFPKSVGFRDWINRLHNASIVHRTSNIDRSLFSVGAKGIFYLDKIYNEGIQMKSENSLKNEVSQMHDKIDLLVSMLDKEQKKKIPFLKIVKNSGGNSGY